MSNRSLSVLLAKLIASLALAATLPWLAGCASSSGSTVEREQMEAWWQLYQRGDAGWDEARDRWYAAGGAARNSLVLTLMQDMIGNAGRAIPEQVAASRRAQDELLRLPVADTVPPLIEAIRVGRERTALDVVGQTLAEAGAVDALIAALESPQPGDSTGSGGAICRALVECGGQRAIDAVGRCLAADPDWIRRSAAAESLARARRSDREAAAQQLLTVLDDEDPFVTTRGIAALGTVGDGKHAPPLAAALPALRKRSADAERETLLALRRLTGRSVPGDDAATWVEVAHAAAADASGLP
jgi:hypothetical protein